MNESNTGTQVRNLARLPFGADSFDAVTCSHAIYELSPEARERTLQEAQRVLRPGGQFLMMEHREPSHPLVRGVKDGRPVAHG